MRTDSTPSRRENARALIITVTITVAFCLWLLPGDARVGLFVGLLLGAVLVFALWMHETDETRPEPPPGATYDANPVLADALVYYAERRTMNNPKGWAHVLRVVNRAAAQNFWPTATDEQIEDARRVLADLHASERDTRVTDGAP